MSTRKLILTAFICGFAILLAGGIQLLRISRTDDAATVYSIGDTASVAGISVTVVSYAGNVGTVRLQMPAGSGGLSSVADHFSVQRGNARFDPISQNGSTNDCATKSAVPGAALECSVAFAPRGDGTTYIRFTEDAKTAVWSLG
jgi:hypothetical protein